MLDFVDILDNHLNLRQCETRESSNGKWLLDFKCLKPVLFMVPFARKSLKSSKILEILDNPWNPRQSFEFASLQDKFQWKMAAGRQMFEAKNSTT